MSERIWSAQQHAIFSWFSKDAAYFLRPDVQAMLAAAGLSVTIDVDGHLVIRARAGVGKTTSVIEGINRAPETQIMMCAFSKATATDLKAKITNANAEASTLHSIGLRALSRVWERLPIAKGDERAIWLTDQVCGGRTPDPIKRLITKLHSKGREILPHAKDPGELLQLAETFECVPDEEWEEDGFTVDYVEDYALRAMELAATHKPVETGFDFADMIFLPVRNRLLRRTYDLVVVDEAQDMTMAQLEIAQGICRGRICIVGDDRQAIYAFRGADCEALDRLKHQLQAGELGLTVTYRCGKKIVDYARSLVPDYQAAPGNPDGAILQCGEDKLPIQAMPGDAILSRKNAPLASVAMALIRAQKRVRIAGKEIGKGLQAIVRKLAKGNAANSIPALLERLTHWEEREVNRANKSDKPDRADLIRDQAETLRVLSEGVAGVRELDVRIETLFSDDGTGAAGVVTCSSIHKAKGLEWDRVFVLRDTLYPKRKNPATSAQMREEANLEYVSVTRPKSELIWVGAATPAPVPLPAMAGK